MEWHLPGLPFDLHPLIAEAKRRARRRRFLIAAIALAAAGATAGVVLTAGAGSSGAVPWLPTRPQLGSANPPLAPACTASQLRASLSLQGATMSLVGPISIVNRSSQRCSLLGRPKLSFANATSKWRETRWLPTGSSPIPFDPLAPPRGSLRALAPGEHVSVMLWWSNWCGRGAKSGGSLTQSPSAIVLTPPGGGQIRLAQWHGLGGPVCNGGPGSTSLLQAGNFTPFVPQGPPSSALPLKASIVSGPPLHVKGRRIVGPTLTARAGSWLSYTVVLTNRGKKPFRFGRTCPAYTEGIGADENQAYILNCRSVGPLASGQSVRFAMRVRVPRHLTERFPPLGWTLAPHSWNAPQAQPAVVRIR
ncbi:MAG TPA: DUF4232 domain-containing protein [Gaiellaceae bacterium]|nr:DUF4232 domain-containing protein [Gaiellaceae bacterium]